MAVRFRIDDFGAAPVAPPLSIADVHVWTFGLAGPGRLDDWLTLLPADEKSRVERFHFDIHRHRYAAAHAITRHILGRYLGATVRTPFVVGARGKPSLPGEPLQFNLSHSENTAMLGVTRHLALGIDVEAVKPDVEVRALAAQFFSARERDDLLALPEPRVRDGFFHLWTQKEAYLKGRGDGVAYGLDHFDTEANPDRPAALHQDRRDPSAGAAWLLATLAAPAGYRAAIATRGRPASISQFAIG